MAGGEALEGRAMSNHYCLGRIDFGVGSSAFWCLDTPGTLVVFLHGFTGAAEATWHNASAYIRRDALFSSADVLFLGYDSVRSRARVISRLGARSVSQAAGRAGRIFQSLHLLRSAAAALHLRPGRRGGAFAGWRDHAAGGAGSGAARTTPMRITSSSLLFAPAHKGSNALHNAGGSDGGARDTGGAAMRPALQGTDPGRPSAQIGLHKGYRKPGR